MADEIKRLQRPRTGRVLAGVCAGIANYANLDPVVVRVVYVLLTFFTCFSGVIIYVILLLLIPEEPNRYERNHIENTEQ